MGAYGNSFTLLTDEDGEVDVSKLTEKAADMEMKMKKKIQENHLLPSSNWQPTESGENNKEEGEGDGEWKVRGSRRQRDGGEKGGAGVILEKKEVKKEEEEEGEEYENEGLGVEEITKGKQRMRRVMNKKKKEAAAIRKLKGKDRH